MIFHIAVCSPDPVLRSRVERHCLEYYARRADACIVEQLPGVEALLARDAEGTRYELYLIELTAGNAPAGLKAADTLRRHGVRTPLAFFAHTPAHAYNAYRVDAMQYLLLPFRPEQLTALLDRATEPEYGPVIAVSTAAGLRALPFADIEYLECTHHVVHFHLATGEDVPSLSVRVPFAEVAKPLLTMTAFCSPTAPMSSTWRRQNSWRRASFGCAAGRGCPSHAAGRPPSAPGSRPGWNKINNAGKTLAKKPEREAKNFSLFCCKNRENFPGKYAII